MQFSDWRLTQSREIPGNHTSTGFPPCYFGVVARAVTDNDTDEFLDLKLVSADGNPVCYTCLKEDVDGIGEDGPEGVCLSEEFRPVTTKPRRVQAGSEETRDGAVVDQQVAHGYGSSPTSGGEDGDPVQLEGDSEPPVEGSGSESDPSGEGVPEVQSGEGEGGEPEPDLPVQDSQSGNESEEGPLL